MTDATHGLPTPRTTLRARYVSLLVWCKGGCQHQAEADLQALIDAGKGDVPLIHLRFRCSNCGGGNTDWVVASPIGCRHPAVASTGSPEGIGNTGYRRGRGGAGVTACRGRLR